MKFGPADPSAIFLRFPISPEVLHIPFFGGGRSLFEMVKYDSGDYADLLTGRLSFSADVPIE